MLSDQEKADLKQQLKANQHEVFVVSIEEMDAIVRSSPKSHLPHIQQTWAEIKDKVELGANYSASTTDIQKLTKLISDLGSPNARVYVKTYGGKPHIILKGYPGLRKVLTGTKYGIKNPQVIAMGLGRAAAGSVARAGGVLTLVLLTPYRVVDHFLTDEATLGRLIGSLATDVVKVGIAVGTSLVATAIVAGAAAISTLAIGPLLVVVGVGFFTTLGLNLIDERFGITDKLVAVIDRAIENKKREVKGIVAELVDSSTDYAVASAKRILVDFARHQISRLVHRSPRVTR